MMQDYVIQDIRASAVLTTSYVAGTVVSYANANPALRNQMNLLVDFTIGSLTSAQIKVEYSHDGTTYFQDTFESVAAGTSTLSLGNYSIAATGKYVISLPIKFSYIKVSVKGTGTVTSSLMTVQAIVGTV